MKSLPVLVTGVSGQDGAYLASSLLNLGQTVLGISRPGKVRDHWRLSKLGVIEHPNFSQFELDISNFLATREALAEIKPKAIFNLASHSYVVDDGVIEDQTLIETGEAVVNMLETLVMDSPETKFFQASSSEMFGNSNTSPQREDSEFHPRNIYGRAKVKAHLAVERFRSEKGLFSSSGILYNHESPLRGTEFLTRKVTQTVARISLGHAKVLRIGNLSSQRDWGYAPEYVDAMQRILDNDDPDTFVVSTGVSTSVRDFISMAFSVVGIEVIFHGAGLQEIGVNSATGEEVVSVDPRFYRPAETNLLVGDPTKIAGSLGWAATTKVPEIAKLMVESDLDLIKYA